MRHSLGWRSVVIPGIIACCALILVTGCRREKPAPEAANPPTASAPALSPTNQVRALEQFEMESRRQMDGASKMLEVAPSPAARAPEPPGAVPDPMELNKQ